MTTPPANRLVEAQNLFANAFSKITQPIASVIWEWYWKHSTITLNLHKSEYKNLNYEYVFGICGSVVCAIYPSHKILSSILDKRVSSFPFFSACGTLNICLQTWDVHIYYYGGYPQPVYCPLGLAYLSSALVLSLHSMVYTKTPALCFCGCCCC